MNVGEMQRKLSVWAEQDKEHQFFDLYHLLYDMDWLQLAHDYVSQNTGSITAGCDGIIMKHFDENLAGNLNDLAQELRRGHFEPQPVRRVHIPKTNGKLRPLGIPSIKDRIVQEALRMILEPIYEADFCQHSFGFRPNRCTMDAIKCITWFTKESTRFFWIVEGDISSYFDTIHHRGLMQILRRRIADRRILTLIWKFLRAGIMERKLFKDTTQGTPQGGIISPLLANIYLHELDQYMARYTALSANEKRRRRKQGQANFAYIRYADDFVVLCNGKKSQAEQLKEELHSFLKERLHLKLSQEKTKITHLNDGFKFLGFWVQRLQGGKGMTTKVLIPEEAKRSVRGKITHITNATTHEESVKTTIQALNRVIGGWCRYYQYTSKAVTDFGKVEYHAFWCMGHWLGRKHQLAMPQVMSMYRQSNTLATADTRLKPATEFKTQIYRKRFIKPNPYVLQEKLQREELPAATYWTGYEQRPGMGDLRPLVMQRDGFICQKCGQPVTATTCEVDHKRPVSRFKRPIDANTLDNLQTYCIACHKAKTQFDRQRESRMH